MNPIETSSHHQAPHADCELLWTLSTLTPPIKLSLFNAIPEQAPLLNQSKTQHALDALIDQYQRYWPTHPIFNTPSTHCWLIEVTLIDDTHMAELNQTYRDKAQSTDVLSFPINDFHTIEANTPIHLLPEQPLGSIVLSVDWALAHAAQCPRANQLTDPSKRLEYYVMDRLMHGCLHLLGQHHDTQTDYEQVIALQQHALSHLQLSN